MKVLNIKEMSCGHCVSRIDNALNAIGVKHEVSLENKTVTIEDDSQVEVAIEELDDVGFTATVE